MICYVKDLSLDQKTAIESLLGRRVEEGEALSVRAFEPATVPHERKLAITGVLLNSPSVSQIS